VCGWFWNGTGSFLVLIVSFSLSLSILRERRGEERAQGRGEPSSTTKCRYLRSRSSGGESVGPDMQLSGYFERTQNGMHMTGCLYCHKRMTKGTSATWTNSLKPQHLTPSPSPPTTLSVAFFSHSHSHSPLFFSFCCNGILFFFLADLEQGAIQFRKGASGVRRQMWWKNMKWRLIVGAGVLIILAIIIGKTFWTPKKKWPVDGSGGRSYRRFRLY